MTTYRQDPNFVTRTIGSEVILVPIRSNVAEMSRIITLNETAAVIWSLMDGKRSVDAIIAEMLEQFDVNPEAAEQDLRELIESLVNVDALIPIDVLEETA